MKKRKKNMCNNNYWLIKCLIAYSLRSDMWLIKKKTKSSFLLAHRALSTVKCVSARCYSASAEWGVQLHHNHIYIYMFLKNVGKLIYKTWNEIKLITKSIMLLSWDSKNKIIFTFLPLFPWKNCLTYIVIEIFMKRYNTKGEKNHSTNPVKWCWLHCWTLLT